MIPSEPLDLEITVISAKHLKNVNWRNGDLKAYAAFYLGNPDNRLATHADDSGSTSPVWNERFTLPITRAAWDSVLTLEIFHSKPSETPKPLVGTVKFPLSQFDELNESIRKLEVVRPSGRPHGNIRLKLAVKERPFSFPPPAQDYRYASDYGHYYNPAPPPLPDYRDIPPQRNYPNYYYGYYTVDHPLHPLPLPSRAFNRASSESFPGGPSAPVDVSSSSSSHGRKPPPQAPLSKVSNYGVPIGPSAPVDSSFSYGMVDGVDFRDPVGRISLKEGNGCEKEKVNYWESQGRRDDLPEY